MMTNTDTELIDLVDLIDFTLSKAFKSKWKIKYGERLLSLFQIRFLASIKKQKPIKLKSLFKFLSTDSGYNPELVKNFLLDIDFEVYSPIISGTEEDLNNDPRL
jgi:hypothetical protein